MRISFSVLTHFLDEPKWKILFADEWSLSVLHSKLNDMVELTNVSRPRVRLQTTENFRVDCDTGLTETIAIEFQCAFQQ